MSGKDSLVYMVLPSVGADIFVLVAIIFVNPGEAAGQRRAVVAASYEAALFEIK